LSVSFTAFVFSPVNLIAAAQSRDGSFYSIPVPSKILENCWRLDEESQEDEIVGLVNV
jgi:hypothetical protein